MFLVQTGRPGAARKAAWLVGVVLGCLGAFGGVLTLHGYVRPSKKPPKTGFRILGFRISR